MNALGYLPCFVCHYLASIKLSYVLVRRCALCSDLLVEIFFVLSSLRSLAFPVQLCIGELIFP